MARVLVTGGTGLIGRHLIERLVARGHTVSVLSRSCASVRPGVACLRWDPLRGHLSPEALTGVEVIVHLAGANLAAGRWTRRRKKEILDSRVRSAELLFERVREAGAPLRAMVSASAVGYYGAVTRERPFTEDDQPGSDFLALVCRSWEEAAERFAELGARAVRLRLGVVLAQEGGALPRFARLARLGLIAPLGGGDQHFPWIHIEDAVGIFAKAIEEELDGAYNAVAPQDVTNREFVRTLAGAVGKSVWLSGVPGVALRWLYGEMSAVMLEGSPVSPAKIEREGYRFRYPELEGALRALLIPESVHTANG